jgi:hypothetical protein
MKKRLACILFVVAIAVVAFTPDGGVAPVSTSTSVRATVTPITAITAATTGIVGTAGTALDTATGGAAPTADGTELAPALAVIPLVGSAPGLRQRPGPAALSLVHCGRSSRHGAEASAFGSVC